MRSPGVIAAALTALALASCGGDRPEARLMGRWQLTAGANCPLGQLTFTSGNVTTRNTMDTAFPGRETTAPVIYSADGRDRISAVTPDSGSSITYVFTDDNHMHIGHLPECAFERAR